MVENGYYENGDLSFAWDFRRHFFMRSNFKPRCHFLGVRNCEILRKNIWGSGFKGVTEKCMGWGGGVLKTGITELED